MNSTNDRAVLALADGTVFRGRAFGARGRSVGEIVFTTGMTGYQEVLTDPSYRGQIVTMTAPEIGNTGVNAEDMESAAPSVAGFVVRDASLCASNHRSQKSLDAFLEEHGIVSARDLDTRTLVRHIRDHGAQMAVLASGADAADEDALRQTARAAEPIERRDLVGEVSCRDVHPWTEGRGAWATKTKTAERAGRPHGLRVVAIDYGVKRNILKCLVDAGCEVTVAPARTTAAEVLALRPDGVFLSNGPGDPAAVGYGIETVKGLVGKKPIFGICLGHQLLALALGGRTYKLKFGHRGLNQPVQDVTTGRIEITTQNHGFAVDLESLAARAELTHVHLNDRTVEGFRHPNLAAFSVQYHPEASAGPHDALYLFDRFVDLMVNTAARPTAR